MIKIGTRGSKLALWQAEYVANKLGRENCEIVIIKTKGDKIQNISFNKMEGKGFFTKEIETALLNKQVDLAVHSMKDLPVDMSDGLVLSAVCKRENPSDTLLIHKNKYNENHKWGLHNNLTIGTSSIRRLSQIKFLNQNIMIKALRGNVPTRIRKLSANEYDAILLATAGLRRLEPDLSEFVEVELPVEQFLPAPAQGALALQIRENDKDLEKKLKFLNHTKTYREVLCERIFLKCFGGGCQVPLGAYADLKNNIISLQGAITLADGSQQIKEVISGEDEQAVAKQLADKMKNKGALNFL